MKYTAIDCLNVFSECIETAAGDDFACDLHLKICPDYIRLSEIFDDPMYIGFLNITKSKRRQFVKACRAFLDRQGVSV